MTKEQFLNKYGQPNTVVSFKNDAEKMEFLKECERFDIRWKLGEKATEYAMSKPLIGFYFGQLGQATDYECFKHNYEIIPYTPSPKSLIKDGWMGVQRQGDKVRFLPSIYAFIHEKTLDGYEMSDYKDDLKYKYFDYKDIMELYDNLGNLQWKRESAKDIEIERIQVEMNKLADDLSKLKGE